MTDQARLRRRIASLQRLQAQRIERVAQKKIDLDACVDKAQREIDNLRAQQTIGAV